MAPPPPVPQVATAGGESLRACFGVGCSRHHRCARYEAVGRSEASPSTLGTCLSGDNVFPMLIALRAVP
jgi:hypothetical protein